MSKNNDTQPEPMVFTSPLAAWPGSFSLPALETFSGQNWNDYRQAMDSMSGVDPISNRHFCYAGLELIKSAGQWNMEIPLADVAGWRKSPEKERMLLVNWIGKTVLNYITELIDPKG